MKVITLEQIEQILPSIDLIKSIEDGFAAYSQERAVVPPVGELIMDQPPGEVHIKYGYLKDDEYYVIKIASGFYDNPKMGLPSSNGMMLLFSQKTGEAKCILQDQGHLTDLRTATAGAIAAKYLAPKKVSAIGVVGTGIQAKLQLQYLSDITDARNVVVWGRSQSNLDAYESEMSAHGFSVTTTMDMDDVGQHCNLIVTTTPSATPLLLSKHITRGAHITAVGSDAPHKQELDAEILARADLVVADSISQCMERGEIFQAIKGNTIRPEELIELGNIILGADEGRVNDDQITVADLTGVAVQDIQIAKAVFEAPTN